MRLICYLLDCQVLQRVSIMSGVVSIIIIVVVIVIVIVIIIIIIIKESMIKVVSLEFNCILRSLSA